MMEDGAVDFDVQRYLRQPFKRVVVPEDDGSFRAEIQELPGCIALGDTEEEALASLRKVAEGWVTAMYATGQPMPEPSETNAGFSGKLALRLPRSLHRRAAQAAEADGVSLNQFIANCLSERLGERKALAARGTAVHITGFGPCVSFGYVPPSHSAVHSNPQKMSPWAFNKVGGIECPR